LKLGVRIGKVSWAWRLTPVILIVWEAEIGRIMAPDQPGQKNFQDPISMGKSWTWWLRPVMPQKCKEDHNPGWSGHKQRTPFPKGAEEWLYCL
jgi:hypothetical protein